MHRLIVLLAAITLLIPGEGPDPDRPPKDHGQESGTTGPFMQLGAGRSGPGAFGLATGGGRTPAAAAAKGGKTTNSVDAGLRFLKRHQQPDGTWHPATYQANCTDEPKCEPGQGGDDDRLALTAQAALAFMGVGYDHRNPNPYRTTVKQAIEAMLRLQRLDGGFGGTVEAQALATSVLGEAFGMTIDPALRQPAQAAVDRLLALRLADAAGVPLAWGQAPVFDTAATVQAVMALKSAHGAGLNAGDGLERAKRWLEQAWKAANPGWERLDIYRDVSGFPAQWSLQGGASGSADEAGAVAACFLGHGAGDPLIETLATAIGRTAPEQWLTDLRGTYLGTLALFQVGGERWKQWNTTVRHALVQSQRTDDGCFAGSWDPQGQTGPSAERGRLQSTVAAVLSLEIYNAHGWVPTVGR